MKSNFSLNKRYVPTFRGNDKLNAAEQFVAVLTMPTVEDVFSILDVLQTSGFTKGNENTADLKKMQAISGETLRYIPKYVSFENAEDFTVQQVATYPVFFQLSVELLLALVAFAQPGEEDVKNS